VDTEDDKVNGDGLTDLEPADGVPVPVPVPVPGDGVVEDGVEYGVG